MFWFIIIDVMVYYHSHKVDSGFSRDFFWKLIFFFFFLFQRKYYNFVIYQLNTCLLIIV